MIGPVQIVLFLIVAFVLGAVVTSAADIALWLGMLISLAGCALVAAVSVARRAG